MLNTISDYANFKAAAEILYDKAFELSTVEDDRKKWAKTVRDCSLDSVGRVMANNAYIRLSKKAMKLEEEIYEIESDIKSILKIK